MNVTLRRVFAQTSAHTPMVATLTGESGMLWMYLSCGSYQESSFTTLRFQTNRSILILKEDTLAAILDLVSYDFSVHELAPVPFT